MTALIDIGEREILRTVIPRYATGTGSDCATIELPVGHLVATTDPVPPPAAASIGKDDDPYWMGWLLVTINASDLAAAGALPLGFLAAIECEASRSLKEFERLLEGVRAACNDAHIAYVGGNIREASRLSAVGVALGICHPYRPISRVGTTDGQIVFSIGQGGVFWRDALRALEGRGVVSKDHSPLFRPQSQIDIMHRLAARGLVTAAMDNSDGLLPTLSELATKNGLGIDIDLDRLVVPDLTDDEMPDERRMWLGWGDWNVIACVPLECKSEVLRVAREANSAIVEIGAVTARHRDVVLRDAAKGIVAPRLESERFAKDSWMLKGIDEYVRMLKAAPIM